MKNLFFSLFLIFSIQLFAQSNSELSNSLKTKNIEQFTSFFSETIDLNIPTAKSNYSDNQAKILVEKFIHDAVFIDYNTQHNGGGNGRPLYEIGKLTTEKGVYRTYILYQRTESETQIIEFRIEKE